MKGLMALLYYSETAKIVAVKVGFIEVLLENSKEVISAVYNDTLSKKGKNGGV